MASTDAQALFAGELNADQLAAVYLLHGEEGYLVRLVADRLAGIALQGAPRDFNLDALQVGETKLERLADMARTAPMLARRRVVRLDGAERLKEAELESLRAYLERPTDSCLLLLVAPGHKVAAKLAGMVSRCGVAAEFKHPRERELPGWIDRLAKGMGVKLDADGRAFLARAIGSDLGRIAAELDKASLYAGERKTLRLEDLRAQVADVRLDALYKLTDHLAAGDVEQALVLVNGMLEQGTHPLQIMPLLVRHTSNLLQGAQAARRGDDLIELARALGVRPFLVQQFVGQVRGQDERGLERALVRLDEADQQLKSSRLPPGLIMERLIVQLGLRRRPERRR